MTPERVLPGPGSESSVGGSLFREALIWLVDLVGLWTTGRLVRVFGILNQRQGVDQRFPDKDFKKPNERQDVDQDP